MKKKNTLILLSILLIISLFLITSCTKTTVIPSSSSSSESEVPLPSSEESKVSSTISKEDVYNDDFFKNVIMVFGADEEAGELKTSVLSFFYIEKGFDSPSELEADSFFSWVVNFDWKAEWGVTAEEEEKDFHHPDYPDYGFFFPANKYIPLVQKYFNVSEEYLKGGYAYLPEYDGFWLDGGVGLGERPLIEITSTQETPEGFVINVSTSPELEDTHGFREYRDRKIYIAVDKENLSTDFSYLKYEII